MDAHKIRKGIYFTNMSFVAIILLGTFMRSSLNEVFNNTIIVTVSILVSFLFLRRAGPLSKLSYFLGLAFLIVIILVFIKESALLTGYVYIKIIFPAILAFIEPQFAAVIAGIIELVFFVIYALLLSGVIGGYFIRASQNLKKRVKK
jgi:hypothetical protein